MFKIYSDRAYLAPKSGHVIMLYPFWGRNPEDPRDPASGRFDRYATTGAGFVQMTDLAEAEVAVLPGDWSNVEGNSCATDLAMQFMEMANRAGKSTVIFFWSDSDKAIPYEHTIVFRTSLYRSAKKANEFAMPAWSEDFVGKYLGGQLPVRQKRTRAVVGFCGFAPSSAIALRSWRQRARWTLHTGKHALKNLVHRRADASIRAMALRAVETSPSIDANLILREQFWNGAFDPGAVDWTKVQKTRREYLQNMVESDYVLCTRGAGNFSYRLYEALSCGRIPILVDTDCVLPYQSEIDWKTYCVWVDERDVVSIGDRVGKFHASLSEQEFVDLQYRCRRLWETHLSPEGFFKNFRLALVGSRGTTIA